MNKTKIEWCDSIWNPFEENMRREFPWKTEVLLK